LPLQEVQGYPASEFFSFITFVVMASSIIIVLSALFLIAYLFDITAKRTRIPTVLLLLFVGWLSQQMVSWWEIELPDFSGLLPVLGTVGLILIVFEGSIELEVERSKLPLIGKSLLTAVLPMLVLGFLLAGWLVWQGNSWQMSLANAIPFCVISSSIAIPTVKHLSHRNREFIVYESSLSDIVGVTLFGLLATETIFTANSLLIFLLEMVVMVAISFVATGLLSILLHSVKSKVKFAPIIFMVLLIYGVAKVYHLPALIFILVLGLFLGNLDKFRQFKLVDRLHPETMERELNRFKDIVIEATFLIRTAFFLLFGFLISTEEIIYLDTMPIAAGMVALIFVLRAAQLLALRLPLLPLLFVAPRGLITVLLFLSIPATMAIPQVNKSLVIQVVIFTTLVMMLGMILGERIKAAPEADDFSEPEPEPELPA
jgi:potassium/hydrogen antiporter